jgi:hypothetical protein
MCATERKINRLLAQPRANGLALFPPSKPADYEVALPMTVGVSAALTAWNPKAPDRRLHIAEVMAAALSADAGGGVHWAGHDALAGRREKTAFASQLATLGYSPHDFRVTVRRLPSEAPQGAWQRYTLLVAQLRDGVFYRDKRYVGGHGAEWVDEFSRDAATWWKTV